MKKSMKGSFTVEGAIIIPLFLFMLAVGMKMDLYMLQEIKSESEHEKVVGMWLVDDFYRYQIAGELMDD